MVDAEYVVDTRSWIALSRTHPIDDHEGTRAGIDNLVVSGRSKSPRGVVYDEMSAGRDRLWEWVDARQEIIFAGSTLELLMLVAKINDKFPELADRDKGVLGADPYVVALAALPRRQQKLSGIGPPPPAQRPAPSAPDNRVTASPDPGGRPLIAVPSSPMHPPAIGGGGRSVSPRSGSGVPAGSSSAARGAVSAGQAFREAPLGGRNARAHGRPRAAAGPPGPGHDPGTRADPGAGRCSVPGRQAAIACQQRRQQRRRICAPYRSRAVARSRRPVTQLQSTGVARFREARPRLRDPL